MEFRNTWQMYQPDAGINLAGCFETIFCGVRGFSHSRFGGPGEKTPIDSAASLSACLLNPGG